MGRGLSECLDYGDPMERDTIRTIREAVRSGRLPERFTPAQVNKVLKINWAGTFLPKHRIGNPGSYTTPNCSCTLTGGSIVSSTYPVNSQATTHGAKGRRS